MVKALAAEWGVLAALAPAWWGISLGWACRSVRALGEEENEEPGGPDWPRLPRLMHPFL